jgi:cytochrome c peroxidase
VLRYPLVLALLFCCREDMPAAPAVDTFATPLSTEEAPATGDRALAPLPLRLTLDARKVALGKRLFGDMRLSGDGKVACSHCHSLERGGANGQARSQLPARSPVAVNVPSVFNGAFNFRFGWGGGYEDIGEQLDFAMAAAPVMNSSWAQAASVLARAGAERAAFSALYAGGLTAANLREVLAIYSLSLITPNARFDRFLRGELMLHEQEREGYALFREYGCVSCHQGINIGGNMLQRFGVVRDYFADRGDVRPVDLGLFNFTSRPEDRHVFRVPSLRNVALTAPYFHDASAETLEAAVAVMARYQLGRDLTTLQVGQLVAFLQALTGELDGRPL